MRFLNKPAIKRKISFSECAEFKNDTDHVELDRDTIPKRSRGNQLDIAPIVAGHNQTLEVQHSTLPLLSSENMNLVVELSSADIHTLTKHEEYIIRTENKNLRDILSETSFLSESCFPDNMSIKDTAAENITLKELLGERYVPECQHLWVWTKNYLNDPGRYFCVEKCKYCGQEKEPVPSKEVKLPKKRTPPDYKNGKIFVLNNKETGIKYIGYTASKDIKTRLSFLTVNAKQNSPSPINVAIKQYGKETFEVEYVVDFPCNSHIELREEAYALEQYYRMLSVPLYNTAKNPPVLGEQCEVQGIYDLPQNSCWRVNTGLLENANGANRHKYKSFKYKKGDPESKLAAKKNAISFKLDLDYQKNKTDEYLNRWNTLIEEMNPRAPNNSSDDDPDTKLYTIDDECTCDTTSDNPYHDRHCTLVGSRIRTEKCEHGVDIIIGGFNECMICFEAEMEDDPDAGKENIPFIMGRTDELVDLYDDDLPSFVSHGLNHVHKWEKTENGQYGCTICQMIVNARAGKETETGCDHEWTRLGNGIDQSTNIHQCTKCNAPWTF